jgi:hypothetical protein
MELRAYTQSSHMPWHKDEQMYDMPQWECIYTGACVAWGCRSARQGRQWSGARCEQLCGLQPWECTCAGAGPGKGAARAQRVRGS